MWWYLRGPLAAHAYLTVAAAAIDTRASFSLHPWNNCRRGCVALLRLTICLKLVNDDAKKKMSHRPATHPLIKFFLESARRVAYLYGYLRAMVHPRDDAALRKILECTMSFLHINATSTASYILICSILIHSLNAQMKIKIIINIHFRLFHICVRSYCVPTSSSNRVQPT